MSRRIRYDRLPTEQRHPKSRDLDELSVTQLLRLMNDEEQRGLVSVRRQAPQIARAVRLITEALRQEQTTKLASGRGKPPSSAVYSTQTTTRQLRHTS